MSKKSDLEKEVQHLKHLLYRVRCQILTNNDHLPTGMYKDLIGNTSDLAPNQVLIIDDIEVLIDTIEHLCLTGPREYAREYTKKILIGTFASVVLPKR